jgi:hypothetical protein
MVRVSALLLSLFMISCSASRDLNPEERAKLSPGLIALLTEDSVPDELYDVTHRPDGSKEYGVIIRSTQPEVLRAHGIAVQSAIGDVITARVTRDQMRSLLALPSVRSVEQGTKNQLHN